MERFPVPQATSEGVVWVKPNGAFDMTYPTSKTRRGRVQGMEGDISPAVTASGEICLFEGYEKDD